MFKTAAAILAGFIAMGGIAVGLGQGFERLFPDQYGSEGQVHSLTMLLAILAYTLVSGAMGGWITAAIARERAISSTASLALLVVVMSIANLFVIPNPLPLWWRVICIALVGPATFLGGWWQARRRASLARSAA